MNLFLLALGWWLRLGMRGKLGGSAFVPLPGWLKRSMDRLGYTPAQQISVYAVLALGTDLSRIADDEVGCAESMTRLARGVDPELVPIITGTWTLNEELRISPRFMQTWRPGPNTLIIAVTGEGSGVFPGHVGWIGRNGKTVYSNNSIRGVWDDHFTVDTFLARYRDKGRFPVKFYQPI